MSRFCFLRKLRSFDVCSKMMIFYQSAVATAVYFNLVCRGAPLELLTSIDWMNWSAKVALRLAGHFWRCGLDKLIEQTDHPLHYALDSQQSSFSNRLTQLTATRTDSRNLLYHMLSPLPYNSWSVTSDSDFDKHKNNESMENNLTIMIVGYAYVYVWMYLITSTGAPTWTKTIHHNIYFPYIYFSQQIP